MKRNMKVLIISLVALVLMISVFAGIAFAQDGNYTGNAQVACSNGANCSGNCNGICDGSCDTNPEGVCNGFAGGARCQGTCSSGGGSQGNCYRQSANQDGAGSCCSQAQY